ncbi:MAG TPA: response regulator [Chitinispirillaceae bacterium]|nr:response regulator [Chitinispirillaceae bacterium]
MGEKKRVVIVDDSPLSSGQLVEFFTSKMNFDIAGLGTDGNAALDLYRTHKPDLITLDITMPNKDGETATIEILQEFPDAKIIIISALHTDATLRCLSAGASGYFPKPIKLNSPENMSELISTVNRILGDE